MLKQMAKLQQDPEAALRTNCIIAYGKISEYIPKTSAGPTLAGAFMRALKDPFPPCRYVFLFT